jgi:hypothetical protein
LAQNEVKLENTSNIYCPVAKRYRHLGEKNKYETRPGYISLEVKTPKQNEWREKGSTIKPGKLKPEAEQLVPQHARYGGR